MSDDDDATTWVRIAPGVIAQVAYSRYDYETRTDLMGRLTGLVRMEKDSVATGMDRLDDDAPLSGG